jgi:hypothetical protein
MSRGWSGSEEHHHRRGDNDSADSEHATNHGLPPPRAIVEELEFCAYRSQILRLPTP